MKLNVTLELYWEVLDALRSRVDRSQSTRPPLDISIMAEAILREALKLPRLTVYEPGVLAP